jgi:hypothetical protein
VGSIISETSPENLFVIFSGSNIVSGKATSSLTKEITNENNHGRVAVLAMA